MWVLPAVVADELGGLDRLAAAGGELLGPELAHASLSCGSAVLGVRCDRTRGRALTGLNVSKVESVPLNFGDSASAMPRPASAGRAGRGRAPPCHDAGMELPVLTADCSRCFGLCCVLLPFSAASGFGADKPSGTPCTPPRRRRPVPDPRDPARGRLARVHGLRLLRRGPAGLAGDATAGVSWREQDNLGEMAAVLSVMRQLHEMLAHLSRGAAPGAGRRRAGRCWPRSRRWSTGRPRSCWPSTSTSCGRPVGRRSWPTASAPGARGVRRAGPRRGATSPGRTCAAATCAGRYLRGAAADRGRTCAAPTSRDADLLGGGRPRRRRARHRPWPRALFLSQPQANAMRGDAATTRPTPHPPHPWT